MLFKILVTPTGFEPVNAALRGLRLKPLVDGAIAELVYSIRRKISILIDKKINKLSCLSCIYTYIHVKILDA